jgi:probable F420-dependent oxidoreductase
MLVSPTLIRTGIHSRTYTRLPTRTPPTRNLNDLAQSGEETVTETCRESYSADGTGPLVGRAPRCPSNVPDARFHRTIDEGPAEDGNRVRARRVMPHKFRFSTAMPRLTASISEWRAELRRIEDLGYWSVAVSDHFTKGWVMEPVVAMTAAADATSTLRVMPLVLANDYRHPVMLHKALATLDVLSGGRVEIGLGAGWMASDYAAAGLPFDPPGVRVDRLAESVDVIKGLFAAEPLSYKGEHYQIDDLDGLPKPVQAPHPPILVGGGSRRVLELAGAVADTVGINPSLRAGAAPGDAMLDLTEERVAAKISIARTAALAAGRDPAALRYHTSIRSMFLTDVPGAQPWVSSMAANVTDPAILATSPAALHGSVASCVETLQRRREELGLDYIHFGGDPAAAASIVARLAGT